MKLISVVIPSYNEQDNVVLLANKVVEQLEGKYDYELIFVDDGSSDGTLENLKKLNQQNSKIHYLSFSRNFGHQKALRCGLAYANGDAVISMDADMQHPPYMIPQLIEKWEEGYDIVYTQRLDTKDVGIFKRSTSSFFYKLTSRLADIEMEEGTADFRLLDRKVANIINRTGESNLFIRGFIVWMGFKKHKIAYKPEARHSGVTKYTFRKMFLFALNGITSFSVKPLYISIVLGLVISLCSFIYALYAIYNYFFKTGVVDGWTSLLVSVLFIGGLQLIILGIIGEYLGKLFMQTKNRPDYIVSESSLKKVSSN